MWLLLSSLFSCSRTHILKQRPITIEEAFLFSGACFLYPAIRIRINMTVLSVTSFWLLGSTTLLPERVVTNSHYLIKTLHYLPTLGHTFRRFTTQFGRVDGFQFSYLEMRLDIHFRHCTASDYCLSSRSSVYNCCATNRAFWMMDSLRTFCGISAWRFQAVRRAFSEMWQDILCYRAVLYLETSMRHSFGPFRMFPLFWTADRLSKVNNTCEGLRQLGITGRLVIQTGCIFHNISTFQLGVWMVGER